MLKSELTRLYYVYPSWAELCYKWEELPRLFADPFNSGYLDANDLRSIEEGYISTVAEPLGMLDGPEGGGIIIGPLGPTKEGPDGKPRFCRWLGEAILRKDTDFTGPAVEHGFDKPFAHVMYLQPLDIPILRLAGVKKPKTYECGFNWEHVESDPESIYWLVTYEPAKREPKGLDQIGAWASHFGVQLSRLPRVPKSLEAEVAVWFEPGLRPWFSDPTPECTWFRVVSDSDLAGFHSAVMFYVGLHLRKVAGSRLRAIHLVANIEGKPYNRLTWRRK